MKYYIGRLACQHGEYEFGEVLKFKTEGDPDEYLDNIAATWYETDDVQERRVDENTQAWWHNGEMIISPDGWEQVTKELADAFPLIHYL